MNSLFENLTEYLLGQSVHIVWLFILVGAVCLALRSKSAHLRYLLWLLIIAKCLVPSLVTISLAILPEKAEPVVEQVVYEPVAEPEVFVPAVTEYEYVPMAEAPVDMRPALVQYITSLSKAELLAFGWMVGAGLFLVLVVVKAMRTNMILTKNRVALPELLQAEVSELLGGDTGTGPKCYCMEGIAQPFVWGLVRGSIYLPADFMASTDWEHRRQILMHEMAHITRGDPSVNFLQIIAQVVFFFHPLVWVANKFIRAEREKCCDEAAIARLNASPKDYGRAIVDTLVNEYESTIPTPSMAIAGPIKNIENRIKTIMQPGRKFYKRPTVIAILMVLLIAAVTVPVGFALSNRTADVEVEKENNFATEDTEGNNISAVEVDGGRMRVIHFPENRSMGTLQVGRWDIKDLVWAGEWTKSVEAKGDVHVPVGQDVYLLVNKEASKDISPLADLGPDDLQAILLFVRGGSSISDEDLINLSGLTGLKELGLGATQVKGPGLKHLSKLTSLEVLSLSRTNLTDDAVKYIAKIKSLRRLGLDDTLVTDTGISYLNELKLLETLTLYRTAVTGEGFSNFSRDHSLREVLLNFSDVTDDGLSHLANLKSLEWLSLYNTGISDGGIVHLKDFKSLRKLNLQRTKVTDAGMEHLADLSSLEELWLPDKVTDAGLAKLTGLTGLKQLDIGSMKLTGTGLKVLGNFKQLEYLQFPAGIVDDDLDVLKEITSLKKLWIQNSHITNKGLANLKYLSSLKELLLHNGNLTVRMGVTCSALFNVNPGLTYLNIYEIELDKTRLKSLSRFTELEELKISGVPLRDDDLVNLANLKKLRTLFFGSKTVSDGGLAHLSNLTAMEDLAPSVPMTDESLKHFAKMKNLYRLQVSGDFTDEGLKYIEPLKSLDTLQYVSGNDISGEAQEELKKALPLLRNLEVIKKTGINPRPKAGQMAPSFMCESLDGKKLNLDDYRGKVLLMYFWSTWCSPCVASTPALKQLQKELSRYKDFAMISFSLDNDDFGLRQYVRRNGLSWPQVRLGQQSQIGTEYGVRGVPAYILVGPDGKILSGVERNLGKIKAMVAKTLGTIASKEPDVDGGDVWGKAVDGAKIRLVGATEIWGRSDWSGPVVKLKVQAHNDGQRRLHVPENGHRWQIEVDGLWYEWLEKVDSLKDGVGEVTALLDFENGDLLSNLKVEIAGNWRKIPKGKEIEYAEKFWSNWSDPVSDNAEELVLKEGKHIIRVAITSMASKIGFDQPLRLVSNPVEIKVSSLGKPAVGVRVAKSNALDVKDKTQVLIECTLINAGDDFLEDIGMNLSPVAGLDLSSAKDSDVDSKEKRESEFLDDLQVKFITESLDQYKDSKILANPKILVLDGEQAHIETVREIPYYAGYTEVESAPDKPEPKIEYFEKGITLDVTTHITKKHESIRIKTETKLSDISIGQEHLYKGKHPYHKPEISVTSIKTMVIVPDEKTILIGPEPIKGYDEDGKHVKQYMLILLKTTIVKDADDHLKVLPKTIEFQTSRLELERGGVIDAAKWSEGKAMMGTMAMAIRAWVAETYADGSWTQDELTYEKLGFLPNDFNATYFRADNFSWRVSFDKANTKLTYTITATAGKGITAPVSVTLDEKGKWTEHEKADAEVEGENETDNLVWGKEVNGLRAAVKLVPEKVPYLLGEKIGIHFYAQNLSDETIQHYFPTWRSGTVTLFIEDNAGAIIEVPSVPFTGGPRREKRSLEPGQMANWQIEPLIINKATDESKGFWGNHISLEQGKYLVWYRLAFYGRSLIVTGKHELIIEGDSNSGQRTAAEVDGGDVSVGSALPVYGEELDSSEGMVSYNKISPFAVGSKQWLQGRVEDFFKSNYRYITSRKTIEWGEPVVNKDGSFSIDYKYEGTVGGKMQHKFVNHKIFTFSKDGELMDVEEKDRVISLETRFILVGDGFLEEIGVELSGTEDSEGDLDEKPEPEFLDDVQVDFILRATQMHKGSKTLVAPRLTVFDNEPSNISVLREIPYTAGYTEVELAPDKPEAKLVYFKKGVKMDITSHVTEDKKNVRVELEAELSDMFLGPEHLYKGKHPYHKPEISRTIFTLAAIVPDGKTMLIGPKPYTDYKEDGTKVEQNIIMLLKPTIIKGTTVLANPVPLVEVVRGD